MKRKSILVLVLMLCLHALAQQQVPGKAPKPDDRLKADVLLIVAHPDDETGVSAYLAQLLDQGKRVAAVYTTHGEAGHNNMGDERGPSLGVAREMELRHAMSQLGVPNVWFLDGRDTPSQDVLQSLGNWHHGTVLEEVVRIVRITRPEVIISWIPEVLIGENHGDHQAAGVVATEAFDSAGNPSVFPAQLAQPRKVNETLLEGLQPWQPKKLYFYSDASDDKQFKGTGPQYSSTALSPKRQLPYWRVAMDTFRYHRTQYRSYIEKLDSMNDQQLEKLASPDQDGWAGPTQLIFGKSNVGGSATADVFAGIKSGPITFVSPPNPGAIPHSGLSIEIGGPWSFYEDFRRAHGLQNVPKAAVPEIAVAASTVLQFPVVLRNATAQPAEVTLSLTLPNNWKQKQELPNYQLEPGEVYPLEIEILVPPDKNDKPAELSCRAVSDGQTIGTVILRTRVRTGGLPQ